MSNQIYIIFDGKEYPSLVDFCKATGYKYFALAQKINRESKKGGNKITLIQKKELKFKIKGK